MTVDLGTIRGDRIGRLDGLYGLLERDRARWLMSEILPPAVDLGSGLGVWLPWLRESGIHVIGVDLDYASLHAGQLLAPAPRVQADAARLPLRCGSCRTLVFRESAHHFNMPLILESARRLGIERLVFFEPNDSLLLRLAHWIIGHRDEHLSVECMERMLREARWKVTKKEFRDLFVLPISGGWIAPWTIPRTGLFGMALVKLDAWLVRRLIPAIQRRICFRWMIVARCDQAAPTGGEA